MIDWDRVSELRDEVGEDAFDEVVALFLEEVDETLAEVSADSPIQKTRDVLHFLKGSALNLGFGELAGFCGEGEQKIDAGDAVNFDQILGIYHDSRKQFLEELSRRITD